MLLKLVVYYIVLSILIYNILETEVTMEPMYTTNLYNYCPGLYEQYIHKLTTLPKQKEYAKPYTYSLDLMIADPNPKVPVGININQFKLI